MVEYNVEPRVLADVYGLPKHITGLRKCVRPNRHDSYHCRHLEEMDECIQGLCCTEDTDIYCAKLNKFVDMYDYTDHSPMYGLEVDASTVSLGLLYSSR